MWPSSAWHQLSTLMTYLRQHRFNSRALWVKSWPSSGARSGKPGFNEAALARGMWPSSAWHQLSTLMTYLRQHRFNGRFLWVKSWPSSGARSGKPGFNEAALARSMWPSSAWHQLSTLMTYLRQHRFNGRALWVKSWPSSGARSGKPGFNEAALARGMWPSSAWHQLSTLMTYLRQHRFNGRFLWVKSWPSSGARSGKPGFNEAALARSMWPSSAWHQLSTLMTYLRQHRFNGRGLCVKSWPSSGARSGKPGFNEAALARGMWLSSAWHQLSTLMTYLRQHRFNGRAL